MIAATVLKIVIKVSKDAMRNRLSRLGTSWEQDGRGSEN